MMSIKSEKGITLLLSILILSTMTLITTAVAVFTVQEIRSTRATLLSEPAYNAAETGTETGLWTVKREAASMLTNCDDTPSFQSIQNNSSHSSGVVLCRTYQGMTLELNPSDDTEIFLYNPDDPLGDVDLQDMDPTYTNISVTNLSNTFAIQVEVARIDNLDNPFLNFSVAPATAYPTQSIPAVATDSEGRMQITLSSPSGVTMAFIDTNVGLPDNLTLISSGCSARSTITNCDSSSEIFERKIEVQIPSF